MHYVINPNNTQATNKQAQCPSPKQKQKQHNNQQEINICKKQVHWSKTTIKTHNKQNNK